MYSLEQINQIYLSQLRLQIAQLLKIYNPAQNKASPKKNFLASYKAMIK